MGVLGLWQLLAPVGQPVTLESLENKIFAVDISIWLNQAVKGYRNSEGGSVPNAHLLSLFSRLCKLLFYKIRPIIVFDGGFPELKKQTIINRQQRRAAAKQNSREVGLKILTNYLASQQLGQANDLSNSSKVPFKRKERPRDEVYMLPPLPESSQSLLNDLRETNEDSERKFTNFSREDIKYLSKIDIESDDFDNLPPDVKQEILSTLKESRKHRTWDQYDELPKESNDFSSYQMQCLLKKRKLQSKLEQVQKDLRNIHSSAYVSQYTNDHVIGETNKIMSDDTSYYVLLKKIMNKEESESDKKIVDTKPSVSIMADTKSAFIRDIENIDESDSSNDDVKIAIMNSLSDVVKEEKHSLDASDEEYYVDNPPPMSSVKRKSDYLNTVDEKLPIVDVVNSKQNCLNSSNDKHDTDIEHVDKHKNKDNCFAFKVYQESNMSELTSLKSSTEIDKSEIGILPEENLDVKDKLNKSIVVSTDDEIMSCEEEIMILSKENHNLKKNSTESVVVSSDDEMISCEEDPDQLNESRADPMNEVEENNKKSETTFPGVHSIASETESSVINKHLDETTLNSDIDIINIPFKDSLYDTPSTSTKETCFASPKSSDKNLDEVNLELQKDLETATAILEAEQAKRDRQANTVQDHMIQECKELLQLFGIPYIVSPLEAEAQCAFYDKVDLTHGTITDDSDVWLFGGTRVFKNFFTQQKFVECYKDKEIFTHFGLSRLKLINFALLTGSDYTEGIEGVGPVTAMEIISEFPGEGIDALQKFKNWWDESKKNTKMPENKIRAKFKKLILTHNFPDENIFDAYLNPEVDSSTEKFTWGRPDLDAIREYAREKFGWNQSKVDDALLPVLKKLNERNSQTHIDSFFTATLKKSNSLFPSKRIMSALKKITSPDKGVSKSDATVAKPVKCKATTSAKKPMPRKINRKVVSTRGRKRNIQSQGPALSESSSESD